MIVNSNSGKVAGKSASLMAKDYPVGTDYSGTVTEQYVKVGDQVAAGQPLFEVSRLRWSATSPRAWSTRTT